LKRTDIINLVGQLPEANLHLAGQRSLHQITKIVVHHDAQLRPGKYNPAERYKEQARFHIRKNWGEVGKPPIPGFGLMYHLKMDGAGRVYQCQPFTRPTWNSRGANWAALAICIDGGDGQAPAPGQLQGLHELLDLLCYHYPEFPAGRKDVWGHGELTAKRLRELSLPGPGNSTACPGLFLPYVQKYRNGEW
jgi:hypothetical protein